MDAKVLDPTLTTLDISGEGSKIIVNAKEELTGSITRDSNGDLFTCKKKKLPGLLPR